MVPATPPTTPSTSRSWIAPGGTIAPTKLKGAAPDGYTLLLAHIGMSTAPALYRSLPFKPLEDFELVGQVVDVPMTLIARKDFPAKDFKDLLARHVRCPCYQDPGRDRASETIGYHRGCLHVQGTVRRTSMIQEALSPGSQMWRDGRKLWSRPWR